MRYNIKATLSDTDQLVRFEDVFNETKNGFLSLIKRRIPSDASEQFSYGSIYGGTMVNNPAGGKALSFANGGFWNFSTINKDLMFNVYEGIARNDIFAFGMGIDSVDNIVDRYVDGQNFIICRPGIIVRELQDGAPYMITVLNEGNKFLDALEDNTKRKLRLIAPELYVDDLRINLVEGEVYKRKSALIDHTYHIFNEGIFSIEASREAMEIIGCVGLGDLTHMGFGHVSIMSDPLRRGQPTLRQKFSPHEVQWIGGQYVRGQSGIYNAEQ